MDGAKLITAIWFSLMLVGLVVFVAGLFAGSGVLVLVGFWVFAPLAAVHLVLSILTLWLKAFGKL